MKAQFTENETLNDVDFSFQPSIDKRQIDELVTIVSAILDCVLHHCIVINIKGESYRLKERKKFMR